MQWKKAPSPKMAKVVSSAGKVMACVLWDAKDIVFIDYLQGQSINGEYFANLLRQPQKAVKWKWPKNCTAVAAVNDSGFKLVDHPPYSPDLPPSDYYLFPSTCPTRLEGSIRSMRSYLQLRIFFEGSGWASSTGTQALQHGRNVWSPNCKQSCV